MHWIALLLIVIAGWLSAVVVVGLLVGRVVAMLERRHARRGIRRVA